MSDDKENKTKKNNAKTVLKWLKINRDKIVQIIISKKSGNKHLKKLNYV